MKPLRASLLRILSWVLLAGVALQLYFIARIGRGWIRTPPPFSARKWRNWQSTGK